MEVPLQLKHCLIAAAICMTINTSLSAQTNLSELDDLEKTAVLNGFCDRVADMGLEWDKNNKQYLMIYSFQKLPIINDLVRDMLRRDDWHKKKYGESHLFNMTIYARKDLQKKLILGEITLTQELIDNCVRDSKNALAEQWVDYFDYMN